MAFSGFFIKLGSDYTVPNEILLASTYKAPWTTLDDKAERNGELVLIRDAVRVCPDVSVSMYSSNPQKIYNFLNTLKSSYTHTLEKKVLATVFVPETNDYYTGYFYVPTIDIAINHSNGTKVWYEPFTFKLKPY